MNNSYMADGIRMASTMHPPVHRAWRPFVKQCHLFFCSVVNCYRTVMDIHISPMYVLNNKSMRIVIMTDQAFSEALFPWFLSLWIWFLCRLCSFLLSPQIMYRLVVNHRLWTIRSRWMIIELSVNYKHNIGGWSSFFCAFFLFSNFYENRDNKYCAANIFCNWTTCLNLNRSTKNLDVTEHSDCMFRT